MSTTEKLTAELQKAAEKLAQAKQRDLLREQAATARSRKAEKKEKAKVLAGLLRTADAHRKIELGGVVIAAGADHFDPAELCGLLLIGLQNIKPEQMARLKDVGIKHFEARKTGNSKQQQVA